MQRGQSIVSLRLNHTCTLGKVQFGRIVLDRLNRHPVSPLRCAQGQALSTCASLRVNSAKGLSRSADRCFAALRMTGLDLAVDAELSSAFEPRLIEFGKLSITPTVAKIYCYPHMLKGMTNQGIFSCLQAGSPLGLAVATVARPLHPYRTEV